MTGFQGADTEALRQHAQTVAQRAARIIEMRDTLAPLVMDEGAWVGPDADTFRSRWSEIASQMDTQTEDLRAWADDLETQAEDQDRTSEEGGAGGSATPGGSGSGGGSLLDSILGALGGAGKILDKAQSAYSKIKKIVDLAKGEKTFAELVLNEGKGFQKVAEKILSKLNIPSGLGEFQPLKFLNKLEGMSPFLKGAGKFLGKALPFADVAFGLHQMITADNTFSRVTGGVAAFGGGLMLASPLFGPFAPVALGAGAVISAGAAVADLGKTVVDNWPAISKGASDAAHAVSETVGNAASAVGEGARNIGEGIRNVGSGISHALGFG